MKIEYVFILFWLYAILGWILELIVTYLRQRKIVNRGFLLGPYCPIYGVGGTVLLFLYKYNARPFIVFVVSIFICSLIEYLASYILEAIYKVRWWDYTNRFLNVNGRICLTNSIAFGFLGVLLVCYLNPWFLNLFRSIDPKTLHLIVIIIGSITAIDVLLTLSAMDDVRIMVTNFKDKSITNIFKSNADKSEEISSKVRNILKQKSFIHKHLTKAYENLKIYKNYVAHKGGKEKTNKFETIENIFVIGVLLSIILGLILGKIFGNKGLFICIFLALDALIVRLLSRGNDEK